jgi:hypothetical protein
VKVASSIAGVCMIRDAIDIAPLLCGHYLRIGFGHIAFIDDASTDGTYEYLTEFSRRDSRVSVRRTFTDGFTQAVGVSSRSNELIAEGYEIVIPFDSDEFWDIKAADLEANYENVPEIVFYGTWRNFVQNRGAAYPRPLGLLGIKFSARPRGDADRARVTAFTRPVVCIAGVVKCGIKTRQPMRFYTGQHEVSVPDKRRDETRFDILHVPLRYKSELTKRGLNYEPRRALVRDTPTKGWHGPFHREVILSNRADEVWAANSASKDGYLDCYGKRIQLVPDRRLQKVLLLSLLYLLAEALKQPLKPIALKMSKAPRRFRRLARQQLRSAGLMQPKRANGRRPT